MNTNIRTTEPQPRDHQMGVSGALAYVGESCFDFVSPKETSRFSGQHGWQRYFHVALVHSATHRQRWIVVVNMVLVRHLLHFRRARLRGAGHVGAGVGRRLCIHAPRWLAIACIRLRLD